MGESGMGSELNMATDVVESEHIVKDRTVYPDDGIQEAYRLSVSLNAPLETGQYIVNYDKSRDTQYVYLVYPEVVEIPNRDKRDGMTPEYSSIE
jgi:hypothetical protein